MLKILPLTVTLLLVNSQTNVMFLQHHLNILSNGVFATAILSEIGSVLQ